MSTVYDVLIVGGGITGLTLGIALARHDYRTLVIEERDDLSKAKRLVVLYPGAIDVLDKIGVLTMIKNIAKSISRIKILGTNKEVIADIDYTLLSHPNNYLLSFPIGGAEFLLREEFRKLNGKIVEGSFAGYKVEDSEVLVNVEEDGKLLGYQARILIGADGKRSRVRQALGVKTSVYECADTYLVGLLDHTKSEEIRIHARPNEELGIVPSPSQTSFFYYLPKDKFELVKSKQLEEFKQKLISIENDLEPHIRELKSWDQLSYIEPKRIFAQRWVGEHVALVGDSAHTLSPNGGMGLNLALQDSLVLSQVLQACFHKNDFSNSMLTKYENDRRPYCDLFDDLSNLYVKFMTTGNVFLARMRNFILSKSSKDLEHLEISALLLRKKPTILFLMKLLCSVL